MTASAGLGNGAEEVELVAKIDTGAEYCVFQREYAEALGLRVENGEEKQMSMANGGNFRTFGHELTLESLGCSVVSTIYFAVERGYRRSVLGRNGWLNKCRIAIIDHDLLLYFSEYNR